MHPEAPSSRVGAESFRTMRLGHDGLPLDDVWHTSADVSALRSYQQASDALSKFKTPVLFDRTDERSKLIVALMDGTGNDVDQDPLHATNVARFREQIKELRSQGVVGVQSAYTPGAGTQDGLFFKALDRATGATSLSRAESTYRMIVERSQSFFEADSNAKIALHLEGFSRGASQVPLLARMIDARGIPDLQSATLVQEASGQIKTHYDRYHQAPGKTPMSVGLYDPVPTGYMELLDRRLPPSVISGFQISAANERRGLFRADQILPMGSSADGRFLHVSVAGAHSDIGGGYLRGGLAVRSLNLMTDYHNSLFNEPLLQRVYEPDDPRVNVVHHSELGNPLFRYASKVERADVSGQVHRLSPDSSWYTPHGEVAHLPVQGPAPMDADFARSHPTRLATRMGSPPPPLVSYSDELLGKARKFMLRPEQVSLSERPAVRFGALGALGVGASAYDASETGHRLALLYGQDNPDAAQSELARFMGRGTGGWSGGAAAGAAVGGVTGPGALAFIAYGAVLGGTVGEKFAERWDQHRIFNQTDREKVDWKFDGRQWTREELADLSGTGSNTASDGNSGADTAAARPQRFAASLEKSSELNYLASNRAAALAMGDAPTPMDPYSLPASSGDRSSLRNANWEQDPQTHQWSRNVAIAYVERGVPQYQRDLASAQRSAELDALSRQVVESNVSQSSAAIAARYEAVHAVQDWQRHGPLPTAVQASLDYNALVASDGGHYQRTAEGAWRNGDRSAEGNLQRELDATHAVLQPTMAEHRTHVASIEPPAVLDAHQQARAELAATYQQHGVQPFPETLDAALDAVARTRQAHDITPGTTSLALEPRPDGTWDVDSPIAHLSRVDGVVHKVAVTSTAELREVQQAHKGAPAWSGPGDHALAPAHDVRHEPPTPMQPDHPDHALYQQIRDGVSALDAQHGRASDAASERMTASLLVLARQQGLTRVDHVLLSVGTAESPAGQNLFVVQGDLADPAHLRANMPTVQAAQTPVADSMQQFDAASQEQDQRAQALQRDQQVQDDRAQQEGHGRTLSMG